MASFKERKQQMISKLNEIENSSNSKDKNLINIGLEHQKKSGSSFAMTAAIITKS